MAIEYKIISMTSKQGEEVQLPTAGVTCIVGGNNVGKSQLLRELRHRTRDADQSGSIILEAMKAIVPTGMESDTIAWLEERAVRYDTTPGSARRYAMRIGEQGTTASDFHWWVNDTSRTNVGNIASFFIEYASAGSLAAYTAGFIDPRSGSENYALMKLRTAGDLERDLAAVTREAFGMTVTLDRLDIQTRLRVGEISAPVPPLNHPTEEYASELSQLPTLDAQGDGFRSFVGLASQILTHRFDVLLLDEPEAFLHPGQSRILGRWLAEQASERNLQIITATHDRDFVLGLLSASQSAPLNLVRLTRMANETHFTQLSPEEILQTWSDPVLRYSNVLQGLFHQKVIVCEADADCRFYAGVLDNLATGEGRRALADDILFVPAAGKGGMPSILTAVTRLGVEAWAFPDFDVLKNRSELKNILEALGGDWTETLNEAHVQFAQTANIGDTWSTLKHSGVNALPPGKAYEAATLLLAELTSMRLRIVAIGEMESFAKDISAHGTVWVSEALSAGVHLQKLPSEFVRPVLPA